MYFSFHQIYAFRDVSPQAPVHVLIIPKDKDGLSGISKVSVPELRPKRNIDIF